MTQEKINCEKIQRLLLAWFANNQRNLPWREAYNPYEIWISEIMGQQTQLGRVSDYFSRWIAQFPDIASLAAAPERSVMKAWEGLGYYSRARNIQRTAAILVRDYHAQVPDSMTKLLSLPGIGQYTAAAILSIGFNQPVPLVDANVERLFARLRDIECPIKSKEGKTQVHALAAQLLDKASPRSFNQALMELGALVCTPKKPSCSHCPLSADCLARQRDTMSIRPVLRPRPERLDIAMSCGIIFQKGLVYIQQRLPNDIWGGLWEFPGGRMEEGETPAEGAMREILEETGWQAEIEIPFDTVTHHYTRYRVTLHSFVCSLSADARLVPPVLEAASRYAWVRKDELSNYPFPAGHKQLVKNLLKKELFR